MTHPHPPGTPPKSTSPSRTEARRMWRPNVIRPLPGLALAAALLAPAAALVPARASAAAAAEADVVHVTGVEVKASAAVGTVRLKGDREPTFTVFRLEQPTRVVIDLSHADVTALARQGRVDGQGLVLSVVATQFDDVRVKVGRVVVTVAEGTRFDVRASGSDLVVSLRAAEAPSPVARAEPAAAPAAPAEARPELPDAAPAADEKVVRVDVDSLPDGVVGGTRLVEAKLVARGGHATLTLACDGPIARYQIMELKEPGRLALDLTGFTQAPRVRAQAAGEVAALRVGKRDDGLRVVLEARSDRFPPFEISRTDKGLVVSVGGRPEPKVADAAPDKPVRADLLPDPRQVPAMTVAEAEKPLPVAPAARLATVERAVRAEKVALAEVKSIDVSGKGRQTRVILVLDKEPLVEESRGPNGTRVLLVKSAQLPKDLARKLDASALEGPVSSVASYAADGAVRLVVGLRDGEDEAATKLSTMHVGPSVGLVWSFLGTAPRRLQLAQNEARVAPRGAGGFFGEAPAYALAAAPRAGQQPQYNGKRVDFTAKDLDIIQFLQAIGEISKRNIVAADDVSGKVSVRLRNVPWDEALDIVLKTKGLAREDEGNIIRVLPAEKLLKERKDAAEASKNDIETQPLKVRLIPVNYAEAPQVAERVKDILTTRGTVSVDARTNVLVVKDIVDSLAKAEQLVHILDTQTPQVLIEARIVEAQTTFTRSIGIQWGGDVKATPATGNPTGLVFPNLVSIMGAATDGQTPTSATSATPNFVVNMPTAIGTNTGGGLGFIFGSAGGAANLNLRISAAEVNGTIKTVSAPKVTTLDNQSASISQGISVPFSQVSAAGVNTTFIEAKLSLDVTPHVTADGSILLTIKAANNQPNPQLTGANGQPSIAKREANTKVIVKDGDTTVIGGIYTRRNSLNNVGVPFFSKLPIIGRFFQKEETTDDRTEMLIFITPRIVNRQQSVVAGGDAP